MPVFELHAANAAYNGHAVLKDVSLRIEAGERVALLGRSGAGKSTLLRLLYQHRAGEAALVPQDFGLVRTLAVFHNVYMGRLHRHATWYNLANLIKPLAKEVRQVRAVLDTLGMEDKLFTPAGELSGGQQQRTAVGRALFQGGRVLLGDEPVSAVDGPQAHAVLNAINRDYETVVLAMHDVKLALNYTDRVVGIKDGRIALDEPTRTLRAAELESIYGD